MSEKKDFITKEVINPLVLSAIAKIGSSKSVAESIGRSPMTFSHLKNMQSLPALETLGALRILYGLNINAVIDGDEDHLFEEVKSSDLILKIESLEEEKRVYKERSELFEKLLKNANFNLVYTSNLFADNLEPIKKTDEITRSLLLGVSFWNEVGEA